MIILIGGCVFDLDGHIILSTITKSNSIDVLRMDCENGKSHFTKQESKNMDVVRGGKNLQTVLGSAFPFYHLLQLP